MVSLLGIARQKPAAVAQYSAYPPPGVKAQPESPTRQSVTPSPHATILPATSRPMIGDASGGGGEAPARCRQSGRFTPAAATSIRTSPAFGLGTAPSVSVRTPGGPGSRATTWRIRVGSDIGTSLSSDGLSL